MPIPLAIAAPIIGGGLSALSGIFGGAAARDASKAQTKEQAREFNLGNWTGAARGAETAGLRDKLLTIFGQVAGQGPSQFKPRDAFNPGSPGAPQYGGLNPNQLSLGANYKMGDGGVDPDFYKRLLYQLGYKPEGDPRLDTPGKQYFEQKNRPPPGPQAPFGPAVPQGPLGPDGFAGNYFRGGSR